MEKPTERRVGETNYLSTLVGNVSCLMDVPGDGHCFFSCLFNMNHEDIDHFQEKLMSTTDLKISKRNHYVYMVYTMRKVLYGYGKNFWKITIN